MRGGSRHMGDPRGTATQKIVSKGFFGIGENQRGIASDCAQKYLKSAIAADVVEGCPDDGALAIRCFGDRTEQPLKTMRNKLRRPACPRGWHNPFGRLGRTVELSVIVRQ